MEPGDMYRLTDDGESALRYTHRYKNLKNGIFMIVDVHTTQASNTAVNWGDNRVIFLAPDGIGFRVSLANFHRWFRFILASTTTSKKNNTGH